MVRQFIFVEHMGEWLGKVKNKYGNVSRWSLAFTKIKNMYVKILNAAKELACSNPDVWYNYILQEYKGSSINYVCLHKGGGAPPNITFFLLSVKMNTFAQGGGEYPSENITFYFFDYIFLKGV